MGDAIGGLFGGSEQESSSQASFYDPFKDYRAKYASQLQTMILGNPSKVMNTLQNQPGYMFGLDQGQEALERRMAASGQVQSGQEQIGLQNFAQGYAGNFYNSYIDRLSHLAGAGIGPVTSGTTTSQSGYSSSDALGNIGSIAGTAAGLYLSGGFFSDVALKTNINKVKSLKSGLNVYTFEYKKGMGLPEGMFEGVMAQEVEKVQPDAVSYHSSGYKMVDYSKIVWE